MEKDYNKIDDFFKQAFEGADANPEEADWNVPSDEVWTNLQSDSENKSKDRPLFFYWRRVAVAASVLLLLVAGQAIYQLTQLNQQSAKIETIEEKLHDLETQKTEGNTNTQTKTAESVKEPESGVDDINAETISSNQVVADRVKIESTSVPVRREFTSETNRKQLKKQQEIVKDGGTKEGITSSEQNASVFVDTLAIVEAQKTEIDATKAENTRVNLVELVSPLDRTNAIVLLEDNSSVTPVFKQTKVETVEKMPASLTAFVAPFQYNQRFDQGRRRFFQNEVIGEQSFAAGLQYAYPLSKHFYLETGLGYFRSTAQREHRPPTAYRRNGERPNNRGEIENDYNLTFFTSGSVIETDVVVSRAVDTNLENGSELDVRVFSNTIVQQFQIPLLLGFQVKQKRLRWDAKLGILANAALQNKVDVDRVLINGDALQVSEIAATRNRPIRPNQKNLDLQFYASTALSYQMNEDLAVQVEPYFASGTRSRNLQHPVLGRTQIRTQSAGVKLGLRYDF